MSKIRLLSAGDVKQCINMKQAIDAMEKAFLQLANLQVVQPLRTGTSIENQKAVTLTMPAYLKKEASLGVKIASLFPNNHTKNLPAINGVVLLLNAETGEAKAMMDASYLTALRTGAASGLATNYFASDDARHLALIGSGAQAYTQLEAVAAVRDIQRVSVWSPDIKHAKAFAKQFEDKFDARAYEKITDVVKEADIICTATPSTSPLVQFADLKAGVHINAIGSHSRTMRELDNDILAHGFIIVDQIDAALAEAGEVISAIENQVIDRSALKEIGSLLSSKPMGLKNKLTVFKSVGLAIQDISVAEVVYTNAIRENVGYEFEM